MKQWEMEAFVPLNRAHELWSSFWGRVILGFKDIYCEEALPEASVPAAPLDQCSSLFLLTHPHPLISHQCCNPSSPSSLGVVQSWVIGPWIAPFPSLSISCLASDLSLLPTTSISKSGQPHPKRSMIHFSTPAGINLICQGNLHRGICPGRTGALKENQIIICECILHTVVYKTAQHWSDKWNTNKRNPIKIRSCWARRDSCSEDASSGQTCVSWTINLELQSRFNKMLSSSF